MDDYVKLDLAGADPEQTNELRRLQRKRMVADMLMKQSMQSPQGQMVGNVYVAPSPMQGIAQLVQAYMANKGNKDVDQGYQSLGEKRQAANVADMAKYQQGMTGTPEQTFQPLTPNDDEGNAMPAAVKEAVPATQESKLAAIREAIMGNNPRLNKMGQFDFTAMNAEQARKDAAQARMDQLKAQAEAKAETDRQRASDREALVRVTAGLKPPPPAEPLNIATNDAGDITTINRQGKVVSVIPAAGKSKAGGATAEKEKKAQEGKDQLREELDNMRGHYSNLNELGGLPSSDRNALSNAASWLQSSSAGQLGGKLFGTKEQDERNAIKSTRLRLMQAIKNATGMSAQQMNSNMELKTWLESLGDPTQSIESNMGIIDAIEKSFLSGGQQKTQPGGLPDMSAIDAEIARRQGKK